MQVSVENTGGLGRRVTVQVPAERVDQEVENRLASMSRTVKLDGFRPGKVPLRVINQKFGGKVRDEVVADVIRSTLQDALRQENLRPAGEPMVEPVSLEAGRSLEYIVTLEIYPELAGELDLDFSVTKSVVEIGEEDMSLMIEKLRKQRRTWEKVDRTAKEGDQVTIDFQGTVDGKEFAGNSATQTLVELGSNTMIPGFEEQLIGLSAGDEKTVTVKFPDDYPAKEIAGKEASFNVKAHAVSEAIVPEVDEDFVRAFGIADGGVEALHSEVKKNMERELKHAVSSSLRKQVFEALLEKNPVEIPQSLVKAEVDRLVASAKEQAGADSDIDRGHFEEDARRRVALGLVVGDVVQKNQIQLDADRVREAVESIAASYENPDEVVKWYYGNQEMLMGVQSMVMEEQVMDWVLERVRVEEIPTSFEQVIHKAQS